MNIKGYEYNEIEDGIYDVKLLGHFLSKAHVEFRGANSIECSINEKEMNIIINEKQVDDVFWLYRKLNVNAVTHYWTALIHVINNEIVDYYPFRMD